MPRAKKKIDILLHELVPHHVILTKSQAKEILHRYLVDAWQLPRISENDPVVKAIGATVGDILKITRKSETTVDTVEMYRLVVKDKK
ncbi:MAG: DNA-directed RNA polymerase subunit H [Promethearchaeota archaeon]